MIACIRDSAYTDIWNSMKRVNRKEMNNSVLKQIDVERQETGIDIGRPYDAFELDVIHSSCVCISFSGRFFSGHFGDNIVFSMSIQNY